MKNDCVVSPSVGAAFCSPLLNEKCRFLFVWFFSSLFLSFHTYVHIFTHSSFHLTVLNCYRLISMGLSIMAISAHCTRCTFYTYSFFSSNVLHINTNTRLSALCRLLLFVSVAAVAPYCLARRRLMFTCAYAHILYIFPA